MKKALFSLFLAFICLPVFAQTKSSVVVEHISLTRCTPYYWSITDSTYEESTVVTVTHPDTVYVLDLSIDSNNIVRIYDTVAANCVYIWRDSLVWKTNGVHTATVVDPHGCDSVFSINLTLTSETDSAMIGKKTVCGKYMSPWGTLFTQDTVIDTSYVDSVIIDGNTVRTCTRRDSLILTVNPTYIMPTATADERCSYVWRDQNNTPRMTITDTLVHKLTLKTKKGQCDSVISIKVNLTFHIDTTYDTVVCDKFTDPWDNTLPAYTTSQVIVHHDTTATKCIYTDTINLTVNNSFTDTAWATNNVLDTTIGCYLQWGDTLINTVTAPNFVLRLLENATINKCDSVAAVRVIALNNIENIDTMVTPCARPYKWKPLTTVHSLSTDTICHDTLTAGSCTTYYTLNLQFGDSTVNVVRPMRCDHDSVKYGANPNLVRYSFHIDDNGDTIVKRYSGSNVETADMDNVYEYNNSKQCTTYYKLKLNIFPISDRSSYDTAVACNKYTFTRYNNIVLTHSVDTVFSSSSSLVVPPANQYTGNFPHDSNTTCYRQEYHLKLTILKSDTILDVVNTCDRYTWRNDTTYTTSVNISRRTNDTNEVGCYTYRTLNLTLNKTPESHISGEWMLEPGASTTLTAVSEVSGLVYTWYMNGIQQAGNEETFTVSDDGTHENVDIMMTASNGNGCPDSNYTTITFTNIGIEDAEGIDVNIYPNPASRIVNLRTTEAIASVSVYNAIGQQVMLREGNGNTMQLDLYGLANGHYTMRIVTTDGRVANRKFIVSK